MCTLYWNLCQVRDLEAELDLEQRRSRDAAAENKKLQKQLADLRMQADDDHRMVAELSDQVATLQMRIVTMKRQLDDNVCMQTIHSLCHFALIHIQRRRALKSRGRKLQYSDSEISIRKYQGLSLILNSHSACVEKYPEIYAHFAKSVCIKKLHFKMHSDTTLLCSVQPGFLNLSVKIPFPSMLFLF